VQLGTRAMLRGQTPQSCRRSNIQDAPFSTQSKIVMIVMPEFRDSYVPHTQDPILTAEKIRKLEDE